MKSTKYKRTYHLDFSPEVHSDDKIQYDISNFLEKEIVILFKADGGNTTINKDGVYARSHAQTTSCKTFDYIKGVHYSPKKHLFEDGLNYHGENLYAKHSIAYSKLEDYFFLFGISNKTHFLSWDDVIEKGSNLGFKIVPEVFRGRVSSKEELKSIIELAMTYDCPMGGESVEGFVIRVVDSFKSEDFAKNVIKYVRKGHVQTDEHWSKNWIKNTLK